MKQLKTDILIIGAGVAGLSLAMYLKRANINFIIVEKGPVGGKLHHISKIGNYPPFNNISGVELAMKFYDFINKYNIEIYEDEILKVKDNFVSIGDEYIVNSKFVVLATGTNIGKVEINNYDKFLNKGISSCAICDGFLYKNKKIMVIGNNEIAKKEYDYLSSLTKDIIFLDSDKEKVISFEGSEKLDKVITTKNEYSVDAAFIYTKESVNKSLMDEYNLVIKNGHYVTDDKCETNVKNIYSIGDARYKNIYQIVNAMNDALILSVELIKKLHE